MILRCIEGTSLASTISPGVPSCQTIRRRISSSVRSSTITALTNVQTISLRSRSVVVGAWKIESRLICAVKVDDPRISNSGSCALDRAISQEVVRGTPRLSIHDGFAFAVAEDRVGSILLTGDSSLRALAADHSIEVHGVLWVVDEIHTNGIGSAALLHKALLVLAEDQATRLPKRELAAYIRRYQSLR